MPCRALYAMHTPQALTFDAPRPDPQGLPPTSRPHMPTALPFDRAPTNVPAPASPKPANGGGPRALDFGQTPARDAGPRAPETVAPMLGPVKTLVQPDKALLDAVNALAAKRSLTEAQTSSAQRQAQSLVPLQVDTVDAWGAQALEQHTRNVATVSVLRDRINAANLGDVLARASAVNERPTPDKKAGLLDVFTDLIHTANHAPTAAAALDDMDRRAQQGGDLAKRFAQELQTLAPGCVATRDRLAIMLTSLEAVCAYVQGAPNPDQACAASVATPREMDRVRVRLDMLSRACVQAGLLVQTLQSLLENTSAWVDQAEYIRNVLIPARRLAQ